MSQNRDFYTILMDEFERRQKKDNKFSLRKFAEQLGLNPSYLSKIFHKKRAITIDLIVKTGPILNLDHQEIEKQKMNLLRRKMGELPSLNRLRKKADTVLFNELDLVAIKTLNEWTFFAILELFSLSNFSRTTSEVAQLLQISEKRAKDCVDQLIAKGLLNSKKGYLIPANLSNAITKSPFTSKELMDIQKQFLLKSVEALDSIPLEDRDHSGVTIAVSREQIGKAKKLIKEFRRKFIQIMERGNPKNSVYQLAISYYPLTQKMKG